MNSVVPLKSIDNSLHAFKSRLESERIKNLELNPKIGFQPASIQIWEQKYQLKSTDKNVDNDIGDTYRRIAKALADVEKPEDRGFYYGEFLTALEMGAVPAGRIVANALSKDLKSNVSLINCTVSGAIQDNMEDILEKVREAGLTLKSGAGIGYEFSTLRPKGAFVSGVGATTNGPLSFMDIFDSMCLTISSAGGRRGAQMATMDIHHPDVEEFITAKQKDGRLRHFNLSLLITKDFVEAVKNDLGWKFSFPMSKRDIDYLCTGNNATETVWRDFPITEGYKVNEEGKVLCRVYKTVKARYLWELIMKNTYDYGEPGFILIDEVNEMNNNWWCENIRASNPCVVGNTLVLTEQGEIAIENLVGKKVNVWNGYEFSTVSPFKLDDLHEVFDVSIRTSFDNEPRIVTCTGDHKWILQNGDRVDTMQLHIDDKLMYWENIDCSRKLYGKIENITRCKEKAEVFCFTEPFNHSGVFNGIMTGNCGEQPLPPYGSCLLGSINLTKFVVNPFSEKSYFDFEAYAGVIKVFTRMLDNVVELNGLVLENQKKEILNKRRHGMGFLGLGSSMSMLGMKYGSEESIAFTRKVSRTLAVEGWRISCDLAKEKGKAPIFENENALQNFVSGKYMKKIFEYAPELKSLIETNGSRFTHHSSIAPTGTISSSLGNNVSNGVEPSYSHEYYRNMIVSGKKSKEQLPVRSYEYMVWLARNKLPPETKIEDVKLPDYMATSNDLLPEEHLVVQAAAQEWIDSAVSKTINIPTDFPFEDFKTIYLKAVDIGLKGCTTFRFNPTAFQGVLVNKEDLKNTVYTFKLEDGTEKEFRGDEEIWYDGELHTAANLYDALKEGFYGRY